MYYQVIDVINSVFAVIAVVVLLLLIYKIIYHIVGLFPGKKYPPAKKNHKYAVVVSARNEKNVIAELIESIKAQDYPSDLIDIIVVADNCTDDTAQIARDAGADLVYERFDTGQVAKGYALDYLFNKIFTEHGDRLYDAYFIFDADNVLAPDYISQMNRVYDAGYKIGLGYRNSKNWNDGWVASCTALTFSMINTFQNKCRTHFNANVIVSGTGFFIADQVLKDLGGWPFYTLTEDYEISLYICMKGIKSTYCEWAEYFDEQPSKVKVSWKQRVRWIKGFNQNQKTAKKLLKSSIISRENRWAKFEFGISIMPVVCLITSVMAYGLIMLVWGVVGLFMAGAPTAALVTALSTLASTYVFFAFYATVMLLAERRHIDITVPNAIKCVLMAPVFFGMYLPLYITAMFKKDIKWEPIEHGQKKQEIAD